VERPDKDQAVMRLGDMFVWARDFAEDVVELVFRETFDKYTNINARFKHPSDLHAIYHESTLIWKASLMVAYHCGVTLECSEAVVKSVMGLTLEMDSEMAAVRKKQRSDFADKAFRRGVISAEERSQIQSECI
jgi:hypothetical protein